MKPIIKSYLVEINLGSTVPGNNSNILFQDFPQLRDVMLFGICSMDTNTLTVSPTGKTVVTQTGGITLTLLDTFNQEILHQYPTKALDPYYNSGFYRDIQAFPLQLTKSFITITDNTSLSANQSVCFNIFYQETKFMARPNPATTLPKRR